VRRSGTWKRSIIRSLNRNIGYLAERHGIVVRTYRRSDLRHSFAEFYGATNKIMIAETIAKEIPDLSLAYVASKSVGFLIS
jgi:hypothetical protein